jgi:hypothetical protein
MTTKTTATTPVLERLPSCSFETPEPGKPVRINPLKRTRDFETHEEPREDEELRRNELSPRRLDMGKEVVLANPEVEEEEQPLTQVYEPEDVKPALEEVPETPQDESEEGELAQSPAF